MREIGNAPELPADDVYEGAIATAVRAKTAAERTDALREAGLIQEDELDLHTAKDLNPGDEVFNYSNGKDQKFTAHVTGTPNDKVIIYDITGQPTPMTRQQALMRLQKMYGPDDQFYPGMPVFYRRPPVKRPEPTFECPSETHKHRRKFWTAKQAMEHFENRHSTEFRRKRELEASERDERGIAAQERSAALMEKLVEQGMVSTVTPSVVEPEPELRKEPSRGKGAG